MAQKKHGHYCKVCGEHKSNEKFSGKGHNNHICKSCSKLSASEKSELMTMTKLYNMQTQLINEDDKKWLQNRTRDKRPQVKELANEIYNIKFSSETVKKRRSAMTEIKLFIKDFETLSFLDEGIENCRFIFNRKEKMIQYFEENIDLENFENILDDIDQTTTTKIFKKVSKHFQELEDYCQTEDDIESTWALTVSFQDGTEKQYNSEYVPECIYELCNELYNLVWCEEEIYDPYFLDTVYYCDDLIDMAQAIENLFTGDEANDEDIAISNLQDISTLCFTEEYENDLYRLYTEKNAKLKFIQTFVMSSFRENLNVKQTMKDKWMFLCEHIKENFTSPVGEIISKEEVIKILDLLEENYQLISKISQKEKLDVLLIENTNKNVNSICNSITNALNFGEFRYEIYCFSHRKKDEFHPIYVFLHELGHVLNTHLIKDATKAPSSFMEFSEKEKHVQIKSDVEALEIFADTFAVVMLCKFGFKDLSPFEDLTDMIGADFAQYFENLLTNEI
ncbi:MAG: hypothetical protein R3Y09_13145 [Clostridia bacterium]